MAKNMTRGGIAIAAGAALVATGLVASPAYAVTYIETAVAEGKTLNTLVGANNGLTLNTEISSLMSNDDDDLAYRIENPDEVDFGFGILQSSDVTADVALDTTDETVYDYGTSDTISDENNWSGPTAFDTDNDDVVIDLTTTTTVYTSNNLLHLAVADGTAKNYTLTVTAWLDTDNDQTIDSTEQAAESVTITFYDEDNVSAVSTVSRTVNGEDKVEITTVLTPELNGTQLGGSIVDVEVTAQGNANAVFASKTMKDDGTMGATSYNSTTKIYTTTAYLDYSLHSDAWTGTDSSYAFDEIDLSAVTQSKRFAAYNTTQSSGVVAFGLGTPGAVIDLSGGGTEAYTQGGTATHYYLSTLSLSNGATVAAGVVAAKASVSLSSDVWAFPLGSTSTENMGGDVGNTVGQIIETGTFRYLVASSVASVTTGSYAAESFLSYSNDAGTATTESLADASATGVVAAGTYDVEAVVASADNYTYAKSTAVNGTLASAETSEVRKDYTGNVPVTITVDDDNADPVGAGVAVTVEVSGESGDIDIDGTAVANGTVRSYLTNASGQVTFNVSAADGDTSDTVTLTVRAASSVDANSAEVKLDWNAPGYTLYDLNDPADENERSMIAGGGTSMNFALVDQFGDTLESAAHRLKVTLTGRTVATSTYSLANGAVNVPVSDNALGSGTTVTVDVATEELSGSTWAESFSLISVTDGDMDSGDEITVNVRAATVVPGIVINADETNTLAGGDTAEHHANVKLLPATAADNRLTSADSAPDESSDNTVLVSGKVVNATTLAALPGEMVTISGPSSILFKADSEGGNTGQVYSFGSATVYADGEGHFTFEAWSNVQQTDTELTVTSGAGSETVDVTFGGVKATAGTAMTVDAPAYVSAGSTLVSTATLTDVYGNPVDTSLSIDYVAGATTSALAFGNGTAADGAGEVTNFKVTYVGKGVTITALPTATDGDGEAKVQALLGQNDSGTITITYSYDHDNDGNYTDTDDIVVVRTITIGEAPAEQKVNAGSFKGYVAVYARGYEGQRLSAKIGNDWVIVDPIVNNQGADLFRVTDFTGAGVDIAVRIYIDRVLMDTINLTTK